MKPKIGKVFMPKLPTHTLTWSAQSKSYALVARDHAPRVMVPGDEETWVAWLTTHSSFSFHGQSGHLSVLKESRKRGAGYWYAYHTVEQQTRKRYLGPSGTLTFARLEEAAQDLSSEPAPPSHSQAKNVLSSSRAGVLLSSKLSPPRLPNTLVERACLFTELDAVGSHSLTLVSASAGSGKTTLLSAWMAAEVSPAVSRSRAGRATPAFSWLSLEELDNDPIRFWASAIAALRAGLSSVGQTALAMLHAPEAPPLSAMLTTLLHEIEQVQRELILILDDYHVISDQTIHTSMRFVLDHLPANLHLVLATRTDPELPLSRWRAHGHLLEIRDITLRFTQEEASTFLREGMKLPLSDEVVRALHMRTEGWIAGMQLAALSLSKREDPLSFVKEFAGSHRFVLDFVQQEILAHLPDTLRDFVLQTAILPHMNAALCQAVTALPAERTCQEMLVWLERANLFVVPLDNERQWYRYHDLFREALLAQVRTNQPEQLPALHLRAAHWYESAGELREAMAHALAAHDYPYAASLLEEECRRTHGGVWLSREGRTVLNWMLALPDTLLCSYTRLALDAALSFFYASPSYGAP
jgi:LuxR family maltose regulon positive regulatory protein